MFFNILNASAVFPTLGREAINQKRFKPMPPTKLSNSRKPVLI